jgi:hypothetical protein
MPISDVMDNDIRPGAHENLRPGPTRFTSWSQEVRSHVESQGGYTVNIVSHPPISSLNVLHLWYSLQYFTTRRKPYFREIWDTSSEHIVFNCIHLMTVHGDPDGIGSVIHGRNLGARDTVGDDSKDEAYRLEIGDDSKDEAYRRLIW